LILHSGRGIEEGVDDADSGGVVWPKPRWRVRSRPRWKCSVALLNLPKQRFSGSTTKHLALRVASRHRRAVVHRDPIVIRRTREGLEEHILLAWSVFINDITPSAAYSPRTEHIHTREVCQDDLAKLGNAEHAGRRCDIGPSLVERVIIGAWAARGIIATVDYRQALRDAAGGQDRLGHSRAGTVLTRFGLKDLALRAKSFFGDVDGGFEKHG
jgi:hypothetical protein